MALALALVVIVVFSLRRCACLGRVEVMIPLALVVSLV